LLTHGQHLLVEYWGCDSEVLDDLGAVEALMKRAAEAAGATVVQSVFHRFSPQGVTGVVVVEESHLSIHTWPEVGYASVDFYTCGDCRPDKAHRVLEGGLKPSHSEKLFVRRGVGPQAPSMVLDEHVVERRRDGKRDSSSNNEEQGEADPARPGRPVVYATA